MKTPILTACALVMSLGAPAQAGDAAAGLTFARDVCADCHAVEAKPQVIRADGPPSFAEIARNPGYSSTAVRVFLRSPHDQMPDIILTPVQTDDIIAYFDSLRPEE